MKKQNSKNSGSANPVEIQAYLKGVSYPATKQDIRDKADENSAPEKIMDLLDQVADREYSTPAELTKEIGSLT